MDLRSYNPSNEQIERAKDLACRGLMCYQPFIFSEDLETGAGFEFAEIAEFAGMVYCPEVPAQHAGNKDVARFLIDPAKKEQFSDYNARLRVLYEAFIESIEQHVGPINAMTFADIGCCSGYFPMSFAKRGSPLAVGFDRIDYSPTFELLNGILGTNARFVHKPYRGEEFAIHHRVRYRERLRRAVMAFTSFRRNGAPGDDLPSQFDVVLSIAVLVHLSDPLQHLAYLGQLARKAILVWTYTSEDEEDELTIRYLSYNRYYAEDKFPYCFDVMKISPGLLRKSLELMGFTKIHTIENRPGGMPDLWFRRQRGYLAMRP